MSTAHTNLEHAPDFLTADEVASILRVSKGSIYAAIRARTLPAIHIGRRVVISRKALLKLMDGEPSQGGLQEGNG